jgi:hypothetical protein
MSSATMSRMFGRACSGSAAWTAHAVNAEQSDGMAAIGVRESASGWRLSIEDPQQAMTSPCRHRSGPSSGAASHLVREPLVR